MRDYTEGDRDRILHLLEEDLLALLAIEPETGAYEVVYTDSSARDLAPPVRGDDFFGVWQMHGLPSVAAEDRARMARETSLDFLLDQLKIAPVYNTTCRFLIHGEPVYCRIRVRRDAPDPGTIVLGIRNIDAEMRFEQTIQTRLFTQQMHPHFLYNALSSIREVVLTDPDFAADLLYDFTTYLRAGIAGLLLSTTRGQMADTSLFDCDYYDWLDKGADSKENFEGEFLSEYSWSEYLTGSLYEKLFE